MSLRPIKFPNQSSVSVNSNTPENTLKRVYDIILSPDHPRYSGPSSIGTIFFGDLKKDDTPTDINQLSTALPKNLNNFQCPAIGDIVEVIRAAAGGAYYPGIGGDRLNYMFYYSPSINVHSSVSNNALPSAKVPDPRNRNIGNEYSYNIEQGGIEAPQYTKEFTGTTKDIVISKINNYLRGIGFDKGLATPGAPQYSEYNQYSEYKSDRGLIIYKLDNSFNNEHKLGAYLKEGAVSTLLPMEGDIIQQGRNGQSIRFSSTTPDGINPWSTKPTNIDGDGNPSIGDPLIVMRVSDPSKNSGPLEDINKDASSIYLTSNQNIVNFSPSDDNVDSLKSKYNPIKSNLEVLESLPPSPIPNTPIPPLQPTSSFIDILPLEEDIPEIEMPVYNEDPVFDALDIARDEELLTYTEYGTDDGDPGVYDGEIYGEILPPPIEYDPTTVGSTPTVIPGGVGGSSVIPPILFENVTWASSPSDVNINDIDRSRLVYPFTNGRFGSRSSTWGSGDINNPYKREPYRRYPEFGSYRGIKSDGKPRFHVGIDLVPRDVLPKTDLAFPRLPLLRAIGNGRILYMSTDSGGFRCASVFAEGGNNADCGGRFGNYIAYQLTDYPQYAIAYAHCFSNSIQINPRTGKKFKPNDEVLKGEPIAVMGSSGNSSGWHLHMEIIDISRYVSKINTGQKGSRGWFMGSSIKRYDPQSLWPEFKLGYYW